MCSRRRVLNSFPTSPPQFRHVRAKPLDTAQSVVLSYPLQFGEEALETQKGIVEIAAEKIWKFFSSVKLAVVLLIILAIVSVIGTVIQQN
jgi:hypothetical protein